MKKKPSASFLVSLIISTLILGGPMTLTTVANDSGSFFAGYSLNIKSDKLLAAGTDAVPRAPLEPASFRRSAELMLARFVGQEELTVGQLLRVRVMIDPAGQSINLVDAELTFSSSTLRLIQIDSDPSDFSLHLVSNKETGVASLIAMQPWPGIATSSVVADLVFMAQGSGPAEINFAPASSVLANDGFGTDVLKMASAINFTVNN